MFLSGMADLTRPDSDMVETIWRPLHAMARTSHVMTPILLTFVVLNHPRRCSADFAASNRETGHFAIPAAS